MRYNHVYEEREREKNSPKLRLNIKLLRNLTKYKVSARVGVNAKFEFLISKKCR